MKHSNLKSSCEEMRFRENKTLLDMVEYHCYIDLILFGWVMKNARKHH
jgi:hypothetical protein